MKKLLLAICSFLSFTGYAQVDGRVFTITSTPYTNLSTPTVITTPGWDDFSAQVPLGFNLTFWGQTTNTIYFDSVGLGADMQISPVSPGNAIVFLTDFYDKGGSTVAYKTDTANSKKITKIQWKNVGFYDDTSATQIDSANFQVWFYETSGDIEVHWGNSYIQDSSVFFLKKALFAFAKNFSSTLLGPSFDSSYYVSATNPATFKYLSYFEAATYYSNGTPLGFANTYPTPGTVFKFAKTVTGINGVKLNSYTEVYPTLVSGTTTVMLNKDIQNATIRLIDISGRIVATKKAVSGKNDIDMSALASGSYMLNITTPEESVFYKISKQ